MFGLPYPGKAIGRSPSANYHRPAGNVCGFGTANTQSPPGRGRLQGKTPGLPWPESPIRRSLAEEFDDVRRGGPRLPERDPAVAAQGEFLAPQDDLLVALDGDEGAVGAVVGEDE